MARRRRSFRGNKRMGRQGLWIRHETFNPSTVVTAPLLTEDAVVFPSLWEREFQDITTPKSGAGGAIMKRMFGSATWEVRENATGDTVITPTFETLVFVASTNEPAATAAGDFTINLEQHRVLHYSMFGPQAFADVAHGAERNRWYATQQFDIKVAARLTQNDIVIMLRCSETETVNVTIGVRLVVSAYVTTP